jgi:hypothetical protein
MMANWLTKDERLQLHEIKEDYLQILHTNVEMRDENPDLWHRIVDQWEAVKLKLEDDEHDKIMSTATIHSE